ncbi:MAG: Gfo/Idh/MocA family oxidoreductase, partial [Verrucomicrobiota bacterium]
MATKVGIIGAGGMVRYHIEGFRAAGAEVAVIADMNEAEAQAAAQEHGIPQYCGSTDQLFAMTEIDAVSIIVPNKFHAPLSIQALQAGKHVFCEKPPAISTAEVTEMIEVRNAAGKQLMFNFNNRAR